MCFRVQFNLIDNDTGEILTRNKQFTYNTEVPDCRLTFTNWLNCFCRGLAKGRNLTIELVANRIEPPIYVDIF